MRRRWIAGIAAGLLLVLLSGCMREGAPRTIIIADSASEPPANYGTERFAVDTIYRLPDGGEIGRPLGWADPDTIMALFEGEDESRRLELVNAPYDTGLKLEELGARTEIVGLSPDGRYVTLYEYEDGELAIVLYATDNRSRTTLVQFAERKLLTRQPVWSGNGRYVALAVAAAGTGQQLGVYDTAAGAMTWYAMPESERQLIVSVRPADDGRSAAVVASDGRTGESSVTIGSLTGGGFVPVYAHSAANSGEAEWINDGQLAFAGPDNALYAYDSRNGALAVVLEQISSFRLSPDRKAIAYALVGEDKVYTAELRGNNVLNETAVYQGVTPLLLAWSPDNRKLIVGGWKPYARDFLSVPLTAERAAPVQEGQLTSGGYQWLVVAFQ